MPMIKMKYVVEMEFEVDSKHYQDATCDEDFLHQEKQNLKEFGVVGYTAIIKECATEIKPTLTIKEDQDEIMCKL